MAILAVYQPDRRLLARIVTALGHAHELLRCPDWESFQQALEGTALDGCILDIHQPAHPVGMPELQRLRKRHANLAIVVYADFRGREMELFTLGRLQIDGVILAEQEEDAWRMRETVSEALASSVATRVVAALRSSLSRTGLDVLSWGIQNVHREPRTADLAAHFRRSHRSLAHRLRDEGAPPPGRLLSWSRLFRAIHMLSDGSTTVEAAAWAVGYSSGAALGRAFRSLTGHPPVEVLRRGGIACVLDAFVRKETGKGRRRAASRWRSVARPLPLAVP